MAEQNPQSQDKRIPASPMPQDYYSVLVKVIEAVSSDPAQLRKLVYAMSWHNLRLDSVLSRPLPDATQQARTILELERALELELAIERVEADAARAPQISIRPPEESAADTRNPPREDISPYADDGYSIDRHLRNLKEHSSPLAETQEPSVERGSNSNAVILRPEQPPAWLQRTAGTIPDRPPLWLDRRIGVSGDTVDYDPIHRSRWIKPGLLSFLQLVGAVVAGIALYVGISGWVHLGRQMPANPAHVVSVPQPASAPLAASDNPGVAGQARSSPPQPQPEPRLALSFPVPKTYGVYAGGKGRLTELQPLPIRIPDPRIQLSAEIKEPSRAIVGDGKLAFVVFKRDLLNSAPQTVSVRVVARVARDMKFVGGKAIISPIEGAWRIRSKAYQFKVSPLEGHREMILIEPDPDFVFPAGRYALVLNGLGYDFTVPGPITSPEQCLEQAAMLNGTVLSECPTS
jgi:hypothetical protein